MKDPYYSIKCSRNGTEHFEEMLRAVGLTKFPFPPGGLNSNQYLNVCLLILITIEMKGITR